MVASTTLITNINTLITTGPNAATKADNLAPAGKIVDYVGMLYSVQLTLKETLNKLTLLVAATDATDSTNLTILQNMVLTFS